MSLIAQLAPHFERYLTLERVHPQATYNYGARKLFGLPVIETTCHVPKYRPDSWLCIAAPTSSPLANLGPSRRVPDKRPYVQRRWHACE